MKKKLLVMASTFPRWKNDTNPPFVYELSKRLVDDFDITVLTPNYPGSKLYEEMDDMKVYRFRYFFKKYEKLAGSGGILPTLKKNKLYYLTVPFFLLGEYLKAKKLIKKEKFDVIHAHWVIPQGLVAYWLKKTCNIDYVVTSHGSDIMALKKLNFIKKPILRNAKKITVVSNAIKNEVLENIDKNLNIEVIPMGVDTDLFNPNKKDLNLKKELGIKGAFLLFVGRLAPEKGIDLLIRAMPRVLNEYPETKLVIIGEGNLEKELKKMTKDLNVTNNVLFLGKKKNIELPKYYATADFFIGPSRREGLGLTFAEAGLCGCYLIGTNVGGIPEIINGGVGKIIQHEKLEKEIIHAIKIKKINQTGIKSLSYFKFDKIIKEYIKVLK
jgi:glycosyltransferase involved in cell wall biosynthesis